MEDSKLFLALAVLFIIGTVLIYTGSSSEPVETENFLANVDEGTYIPTEELEECPQETIISFDKEEYEPGDRITVTLTAPNICYRCDVTKFFITIKINNEHVLDGFPRYVDAEYIAEYPLTCEYQAKFSFVINATQYESSALFANAYGINDNGEITSEEARTIVIYEVEPEPEIKHEYTPQAETPGFELIFLIIAVGLAVVIFRRRKK